MNKLKLGLLAGCALLMTVVILQNTGEAETKILFYSVKMPLAFLLFMNAFAGFIIGVLACYLLIRRKTSA